MACTGFNRAVRRLWGDYMKPNKVILRMKSAEVINIISDRLDMSINEVIPLYYQSYTYSIMKEGVADIHCQYPRWIADVVIEDLMEEGKIKNMNIVK